MRLKIFDGLLSPLNGFFGYKTESKTFVIISIEYLGSFTIDKVKQKNIIPLNDSQCHQLMKNIRRTNLSSKRALSANN